MMDKRIFLRYISQNIAGMIGLSCYILIDTLFVSLALGASGLAALNLAITVFSVVSAVGQLLGVGGGTDFSLRKSERLNTNACLSTALRLGGAAALLFAITGICFARPLSLMLGADSATLALTEVYVRVTLLFAPVFILNAILQGFVRNDGAPKLAMLSMLISSGSNILLDYVFMFPLGMGIFGAVLATGVSACLSTPILISHFFSSRCSIPLTSAHHSPHKTARLLSYGLSALIGEMASAVSLLTFNLILMRMSGHIGVAAYGVIANSALVATAIFTGLGQGIQPLFSQVFGSSDHAGMERLTRYTKISVLLISLLIFSLVFLFAQPIASAFNHEGNSRLIELAVSGLRIYFAGYLFAGLNIAATAFLSAICKPARALLISLLRSCLLLIPSALVFSHLLGTSGVWISFVITEAVCCVLSLIFMNKQAVSGRILPKSFTI